MNVFIVGSPIETAMALDPKRLHKQVVECKQILSALKGETKAWRNHPCVIQYEGHEQWLMLYMECLSAWIEGGKQKALIASVKASTFWTPLFHTEPYFDSMKRRLYTKDPVYYAQWEKCGTDDVNWYWSPSEDTYIYYKNGKRIEL